MAKRKYIYYGEIERFGYNLQVIGLTEKEVKDAMTKKYIEAFQHENYGKHPAESCFMWGNRTYMDVFLDELYIEKRELGKVYWD